MVVEPPPHNRLTRHMPHHMNDVSHAASWLPNTLAPRLPVLHAPSLELSARNAPAIVSLTLPPIKVILLYSFNLSSSSSSLTLYTHFHPKHSPPPQSSQSCSPPPPEWPSGRPELSGSVSPSATSASSQRRLQSRVAATVLSSAVSPVAPPLSSSASASTTSLALAASSTASTPQSPPPTTPSQRPHSTLPSPVKPSNGSRSYIMRALQRFRRCRSGNGFFVRCGGRNL